ncbi:MAG: glycosyltransferase family 4 protein, partial [Gemmataceae bacterium]
DVISLDKPPGRMPQTVSKALDVLAGLRPHVVHTHQIGALWYIGQAAAKLGGVPVIHTEHGNHLIWSANWYHGLKNRVFWHRSARFAEQFCCVSDEIAETVSRWRTVPEEKIKVVINGIRTDAFSDRSRRPDVRRELGIPPEAPVIGTVGRLSEVKRQGLLLRAVATLRCRIPEVRLLLVGDGPERDRLEHAAAELNVRDRVCFAGYQANPEHFLQAMDIFALTSRSEGLPVSLLEAWAAGLPVVCSAVGGVPKVITHGEDGLLFPSGDEDALVAAITAIVGDPALATRLGKAGRVKVEDKYSLERMAGDYECRYGALLAKQ